MSKEKKVDDSKLSEVSGAGDPIIDLEAGNYDGGLVEPLPPLPDGSGPNVTDTTDGGDSRGGGSGGGSRVDKRKNLVDPD